MSKKKFPKAPHTSGPGFSFGGIPPLYWLLGAIPAAFIMEAAHASGVWIFLVSGVAIIPLAGLMGKATEHLAETMGSAIGGLLNATFGNAAELIIALIALSKVKSGVVYGDELKHNTQMLDLVRASITGSIIGNVLLVLGLSILLGGLRNTIQKFNRTAAGMGATLLALAAIALLLPTAYFHLTNKIPGAQPGKVVTLSDEIAVILIITYVLSLLFTLKTHHHLFAGEETEVEKVSEHAHEHWSRKKSIIVLLSATVGVAIMSEMLIGAVHEASAALGMTEVFVGVIVVAVVGNAAEHSTAVLVALKNKMDLAVNIAVGSSIQIALFVAPVLLFASVILGHNPPLDFHFSIMEMISVLISIAVLTMVCQDGESHWMEGVMLLAVYIMIGLTFYNLPGGSH